MLRAYGIYDSEETPGANGRVIIADEGPSSGGNFDYWTLTGDMSSTYSDITSLDNIGALGVPVITTRTEIIYRSDEEPAPLAGMNSSVILEIDTSSLTQEEIDRFEAGYIRIPYVVKDPNARMTGFAGGAAIGIVHGEPTNYDRLYASSTADLVVGVLPSLPESGPGLARGTEIARVSFAALFANGARRSEQGNASITFPDFSYGCVTIKLNDISWLRPGVKTLLVIYSDAFNIVKSPYPPSPLGENGYSFYAIAATYSWCYPITHELIWKSLFITPEINAPTPTPPPRATSVALLFEDCSVYYADVIERSSIPVSDDMGLRGAAAESILPLNTSRFVPQGGDLSYNSWFNDDTDYTWINHEISRNVVEPSLEDTQAWTAEYSQVTLRFDTSDIADLADQMGMDLSDFSVQGARLRFLGSIRAHGVAVSPDFAIELCSEMPRSAAYAPAPTGPILYRGSLGVDFTQETLNSTNAQLPNGWSWFEVDIPPEAASAIPLGQPIALRLWLIGMGINAASMTMGDWATATVFVAWTHQKDSGNYEFAPEDRPHLVLDIDPSPCDLEGGGAAGGLPRIEIPEIPDIEIPDIDVDINLPDLEIPDLELPDIEIPDIEIPDINIPDLDIPDFGLPPWAPFYWARFRGDGDFDILFDLREFEALRYTRRWRGGGSFELTFYQHDNLPPEMTTRNVVVEIYRNGIRDFIGRVKWLQVQLAPDGRRIFKWTIRGYDLSDVVRKRLALPNPAQVDLANRVGGDVDRFTGPAAAALAHYVWANAVEPTEAARVVPWLKIGGVYAPALTRPPTMVPLAYRVLSTDALTSTVGATVTYEARMQTVLQVLEEIATQADLGFDFWYDQGTNRVYFVVLTGADRGLANTAGYPPALFHLGWDDLSAWTYTDDGENVENTVYVAGPGAGTDRPLVVDLLSAYSYDQTSVAQWGRQEAFVSAQNAGNSMASVAAAYLKAHADLQSFSFTPIENPRLRYRLDWDLGDIVTVRAQVGPKVIQANTRIVEVSHEIVAGEMPRMQLTVGTVPYTVLRRLIDDGRQNLAPRAG